jgi:hypothetical protein
MHGGKSHFLRLERRTPPRIRRSFLDKVLQTSSSILPAVDAVRIGALVQMATQDLARGTSYPVATLRVDRARAPFPLRELCLILNLFLTFSPECRCCEEQCYWFCNVVLSTTSMRRRASAGRGSLESSRFGFRQSRAGCSSIRTVSFAIFETMLSST